MSVQRVLNGESFASSFGYSLASVDLDGDGFSELVVGAPFLGSTGAVYVYGNSQDGLVEDDERRRRSEERRGGEGCWGRGRARGWS